MDSNTVTKSDLSLKSRSEERVTAKSRPMMSLVARVSSSVSSSTSESQGKRSNGNQNPWSAKAEREDRTVQPVAGSDPKTASDDYHEPSIESSFSARYSKWDDNQAWSSQEWKADKSMDDGTGQSVVNEEKPLDRTVQPVVYPQREARPSVETESELSMGSRSFLNRVNYQVRKRQKRSSMNVTENDEKHSMERRMFMSVTLESAVFMGKNYLDNCHSITNTRDLTLKQMFDISEKLVAGQPDEIYGVNTIDWEFFKEVIVFD